MQLQIAKPQIESLPNGRKGVVTSWSDLIMLAVYGKIASLRRQNKTTENHLAEIRDHRANIRMHFSTFVMHVLIRDP